MNTVSSRKSKSFLHSIHLLAFALTLYAIQTGLAQSTRQPVLTARKIAQKAASSVVMVVVQDSNGKPMSQGSGFFVKDDLIVTSLHVIKDARLIKVKLAGQRDFYVVQEVAQQDKLRDLALLRVSGMPAKPLPLSNGAQVAIGDDVFIHGNPEGLEGTFWQGIISAIGGNEKGGEDYIQISAPISLGSSGAPVLNNRGEVIGFVAGAIEKGQNLISAIPEVYLRILLSPMPPPLQTIYGDPRSFKHITKEGRADKSSENPKTSADNSKNLTLSWFNKGKAYASQNRYLDAVEAFKQSAISENKNAEVYYELGQAYYHLDRNQESLESLRKAIQLDGNFSSAYSLMGLVYASQKRNQEGLALIKRAIKMNPDDAKSHAALGVAYANLKRNQEALAAFKQALRLNPDDSDMHFYLGRVYARLGRYQESVTALKQAIKINPFDPEVLFYLGLSYEDLDQKREAIQAYKQAIQLNPNFADAQLSLGYAYLNVSDNSGALEQYKILKRLSPKQAEELFKAIYK